MPSPFPGMNPYIERREVWHTFHEAFCPACQAMLVPQVRPQYIVKLDEHVYIHELSSEDRRLVGRPDVAVTEGTRSSAVAVETSTLDAPVYGQLLPAVDIERLSYVEIRDRQTRKLVTVIELLSPSNKTPGGDRDQYVSKRWHLIYSGVNFVEIDLLRGGVRPPTEDLPDCDYYVMAARAAEWPRVGLWPLGLRDPLPNIPVPLRSGDADAELDLQALLHDIYDRSGYSDYIYDADPEPPLDASDAEWAASWLASADGDGTTV